MRFLKSITLLLVAALANPMCCCLVAGEMDAESAPAKSVSDAHACCHSTEQATPNQEDSSSQGDHDCYHEEIKVTQINDVSIHSQTLVSSLDALFTGYLAISDNADPSRLRSFAGSDDRLFDSHFPPGSRVSRSLCVYLI